MTSSKCCWLSLYLLLAAQVGLAADAEQLALRMRQGKVLAQHAKPEASCYRNFYQQSSGQLSLHCSNAIRAYQRVKTESLQSAMDYFQAIGKHAEASATEVALDRLEATYRQQADRLVSLQDVDQQYLKTLQRTADDARRAVPDLNTSMSASCREQFFGDQPLTQTLDFICSEAVRNYATRQLTYWQTAITLSSAKKQGHAVEALRRQRDHLAYLMRTRQAFLTSAQTASQPCAAAQQPQVIARCSKGPDSDYYDCLEAACFT